MIFELFIGCMLKLAPFLVFAIFPFEEGLRYTKKKSIWITVAVISIVCLIFSIVCYFVLEFNLLAHYPPFYKVYAIFVIIRFTCVLWYLYLIKGLWKRKFFIAIFIAISSNIIYGIVTILGKLLDTHTGNTLFLPFSPMGFVLTLILTAIVVPLSLRLLKRLYLPVSNSITIKENVYLGILSALLYSLLRADILSISNTIHVTLGQISFYLTIATATYLMYIVFFKTLFYANEKLVSQQQHAQIVHQLIIQEQQYQRICENIETAQRMRHDVRHHAVALEGFLKNEEITKSREYLCELLQTTEDFILPKICENKAINLIIGYYQQLAKERKIDFKVRVNIPKDIGIKDIDISVLLGNLLENAIEATENAQLKHRYIRLNVIHRGSIIVITVDNGHEGDLTKVGNQFLSTKDSHQGLGISSIEHITKKYNGNVEFQFDDHEFRVSVMLSRN